MTGRTPACEDAATIGERLREIQRERMDRIAGCACPPDGQGGTTHRPGCPLEPRPAAMPSQMELATEALWRARARLRTRDAAERYVEHIERACAEKAVRHRVLS
jgi:hypothetical protein